MPSWAANVPRPDGTGVYALGIAESDKVQIAIKKAQLQAQYGLPKSTIKNYQVANKRCSKMQGLIPQVIIKV
jgi:hypothetical protein